MKTFSDLIIVKDIFIATATVTATTITIIVNIYLSQYEGNYRSIIQELPLVIKLGVFKGKIQSL